MNTEENKKKWLNHLQSFIIIVLIIVAFETKNYWLLIIVFFVLPIYRLWKANYFQMLMTYIRIVEKSAFGKPLDRNLWEKGELRNYKVRFGWKEKKTKGDE